MWNNSKNIFVAMTEKTSEPKVVHRLLCPTHSELMMCGHEYQQVKLDLLKRTIAMCLSEHPRDGRFNFEELIHESLPCAFIHSVAYEGGVLFALKLGAQTSVGAIDKQLLDVDLKIKMIIGRHSLVFRPISEFRSKISKTFAFKECDKDLHYGKIFTSGMRTGGKALMVHDEVKTWSPVDGFQAVVVTKARKRNASDDDDVYGAMRFKERLAKSEELCAEQAAKIKELEAKLQEGGDDDASRCASCELVQRELVRRANIITDLQYANNDLQYKVSRCCVLLPLICSNNNPLRS
jgi:hypothetical protein